MDNQHPQRLPTDNDILNLAIQSTDQSSNGVPTEHLITISNPTDRQWLQEALAAGCGTAVDPVKQIISLVDALKKPDLDGSRAVSFLEELLELTERIDYSNDLHKVGGFPVMKDLLANPSDTVRAKSAELFGQTMQNNPYCQEKVLEEPGLFSKLLDMMEHDRNETTRSQALYAISSLLSGNPHGQTEFTKLNGLSVLLRSMMDTKNEKFQSRAAFLVGILCSENQPLAGEMGDMGITQHLFTLLQQDHKQHHQHLMEALQTVLQGSDSARREIMHNRLHFVDFLRKRVEEIGGLDEFQEEKEAAGRILEILNVQPENGMDAER